ncbi:MAG: hypothetical protein V4657_02930 [Pseudomonadota bacterium]
MLDNDTIEADADQDLIDAGLPEDEADQAEADESLQIVIEGEAPEADPDAEIEAELGDRGKRALQAARKAAKDAAAEARAAKAELAALSRAAPVADEPELVKPTISGCGYNEDVFVEKLREYDAQVAKIEQRKQARVADARAAEDDYQARLGKYVTGKTTLRAADMDTAESLVRSKLTIEQQNVLIRNSDDPAKTVLALGRSTKALDDLAKITDIDRYAYALAKLEGKITVTTKSPPPPESKLRGGVSASGGGSLTSQLAAAEKEADRTGDRTRVQQIKRQMAAAGVKA